MGRLDKLVKNGNIEKSKSANRDDMMEHIRLHSTYEGLDSVYSALKRYHFIFLNIP
jgi:hypothetical protein